LKNNIKPAINYLLRITFVVILQANILSGASYADQHYFWYTDSINSKIESSTGVVLSDDSSCFQLADDQTYGFIVLEPMYGTEPFNRGLPSWNGNASDNNCGFLVQMRFPYNNNWSPWLTVGYWKSFIWSSYGETSYAGGYIDYDYVKLYSYQTGWQFRIHFTRTSVDEPSPTLHKISFFISDSRTTDNLDMTAIINDNPEEFFIPTDFLYQYALDDEIGPSICSPTTVSMILHSYDIDLDPVQFARDTYDPHYHLFGIWPRVVQNASEFGLDGAVTRYRSWSEAREVLANGGRIAMSVGKPLYTGHLMMLAGFTSAGKPIVHDPARSNGYGYVYDKTQLSQSWFNKGGVAYTFYPAGNQISNIYSEQLYTIRPAAYQLYQNYPNPFNPSTRITFSIPKSTEIEITVFDILGRQVRTLLRGEVTPGEHSILWHAADLPSGTYFIMMTTPDFQHVIRAVLIK
jgi:hypothetical protein